MFRTVPLSIIRSFSLYTQQWYSWQLASRILLASCQQICMTYTIAVCTVKNSGWWTEELSKICRVLFKKKIEKLVHLVGFIIRTTLLITRSIHNGDILPRKIKYLKWITNTSFQIIPSAPFHSLDAIEMKTAKHCYVYRRWTQRSLIAFINNATFCCVRRQYCNVATEQEEFDKVWDTAW